MKQLLTNCENTRIEYDEKLSKDKRYILNGLYYFGSLQEVYDFILSQRKNKKKNNRDNR